MRQLNKKQRNLLDKWFEKTEATGKTIGFSFTCMNDMDSETFDRLVALGDHETIVQNIEQYIRDKAAEHMDFVNPRSVWSGQEAWKRVL